MSITIIERNDPDGKTFYRAKCDLCGSELWNFSDRSLAERTGRTHLKRQHTDNANGS